MRNIFGRNFHQLSLFIISLVYIMLFFPYLFFLPSSQTYWFCHLCGDHLNAYTLILIPLGWFKFTALSTLLKYISILFQSGDAEIKFQCGAWCCQHKLVIDWCGLAVNKNRGAAFADPCLWWPVAYHILCYFLFFWICLFVTTGFRRRRDLATFFFQRLHLAG